LFYHDWILTIVAVALTTFIIYRHRTNIQRILAGNENLVPFGLYYRKKNK
ncbi:acyl-phosphate glycerol 3-phosphate acyltransferase, partial [Pediococcus pentosaceus]